MSVLTIETFKIIAEYLAGPHNEFVTSITIMQTCKTLYNYLKTRDFWVNFITYVPNRVTAIQFCMSKLFYNNDYHESYYYMKYDALHAPVLDTCRLLHYHPDKIQKHWRHLQLKARIRLDTHNNTTLRLHLIYQFMIYHKPLLYHNL